LSLKPEKSSIPSIVSCIKHDKPDSKDNDDGDDPGATAGSEYIDEIVELKLQLANRRAEIDELKASLTRCMSDKEVLVVETSALVDDLDQCRQSGLDPESIRSAGFDGFNSSASFLRNNILSIGRRKSGQQKNESIQMLLESNSQLLLQNSQLQIENNALRKSLQAVFLGNRQLEDQGATNHVKLQDGQRKGSFFTEKTDDETLSVTSQIPEHWPSLDEKMKRNLRQSAKF
jgi:regulator of replication initiation timing